MASLVAVTFQVVVQSTLTDRSILSMCIDKIVVTKTIACAMVFLCLVFNSHAQDNSDQTYSEATKNHTIYLSLADQHDVPAKQGQEIFDCTDKIFAVLELDQYPADKYQLTVIWTDPSDTVRERTQYDFHVRNDTARLWAWLSLNRGFGSGMLQWVNPAAGLEDFIGLWEIDVRINGKSIGKTGFEVSC